MAAESRNKSCSYALKAHGSSHSRSHLRGWRLTLVNLLDKRDGSGA